MEAVAGSREIEVMRLVAEQCTALTSLSVHSPCLTDQALEALLSNQPSGLKALAITGAWELTSDGFSRALGAMVPGQPLLKELDISGCRGLTDSTLAAVARTFGRTLERLHAAGCPALTRSGVQRLLASTPMLRVLDLGYSLVNAPTEPPREAWQGGAGSGSPGCSGMTGDLFSPPPSSGFLGESPMSIGTVRREPRAATRRLDFSKGFDGGSQVLTVSATRLEVLSVAGCERLEGLSLACPRLRRLDVSMCAGLQRARGERGRALRCHLTSLGG